MIHHYIINIETEYYYKHNGITIFDTDDTISKSQTLQFY